MAAKDVCILWVKYISEQKVQLPFFPHFFLFCLFFSTTNKRLNHLWRTHGFIEIVRKESLTSSGLRLLSESDLSWPTPLQKCSVLLWIPHPYKAITCRKNWLSVNWKNSNATHFSWRGVFSGDHCLLKSIGYPSLELAVQDSLMFDDITSLLVLSKIGWIGRVLIFFSFFIQVMELVIKESLVLHERRISLSEFHTADEVRFR